VKTEKSKKQTIKRTAVSLTLAAATLAGGQVAVNAQATTTDTTDTQAQAVATTNDVATTSSNVAQQATSENIANDTQTQSVSTVNHSKTDSSVTSKTASSEKDTANQTADTAKGAQSTSTTSQDYNAKQNTYNTAKQQYEDAKSLMKKTSDAKDTAAKQKEAADQKLADAKKDVSNKEADVTKAQKNADAADQALNDAKGALNKANADVASKNSALKKAQDEYDAAKSNSDEKTAAYNKAQSDLNNLKSDSAIDNAKKELDAAKQAQSNAQAAYDKAEAENTTAQNALNSAEAAKNTAAAKVSDAQKAADDAKDKVDVAKKALADAQKNWDEAGKKFIESHLDADQTFDAYIKDAIDSLTENNSETLKYMTDSHFITALNKALSVENLEKDADFIEECNKLRAANGLDPLAISYSGMQEAAISAANSSVAANIYGIFAHVGYVKQRNVNSEGNKASYNLENAAWGYDDPYDGWYSDEQKNVNFLLSMQNEKTTYPTEKHWTEAECRSFLKETMGWPDAQIDDYFKEVPYGTMTYKQARAFMNNYDAQTGHYCAVLDNTVSRTGIAMVDDEWDIYEEAHGFGSTTIQEFYSIDTLSDAHMQTDTPSDFKQKLQDFTKDLKDKLAKAKQALADAQAAQTKATEQLTAAQTASTAADQAYTDAQAKANAADQALTDAQNALAKAKATTADKQQAYDSALEADKDRAEAIKAQQKVVDAAKQDKADAHKALTEAETAKNKANDNLTAAKQAQAKADKAYQDANTKVNDTTKALNTAKGALKISQDHQSTAQVEADTALANETAKIEAFKNAQGLEKEAYDAYKKSGDDLVDFVNTHINALPDTDSLTLNDRDDVDTMSKIVEAVPSELKDSLDTDRLAKLDAAKQKMADLILIQKDKDAAKAVADQIADATKDSITADNADGVYAAQRAYRKLSARQRAFIGQATKDQLDQAVAQADAATAAAVNDAIDALPDTITLDNKAAVQAARAAYNKLSDAAKAQVDTAKLDKAEKAIANLEKQKANNDAAKKVDTLINSLPKNPSAKDRAGIMNVYRRYQALSDSAKAMLPEGDLARLLAAMKAANAANPAGTNGNTAAVTAKTANGTASASPKTGDNTAAGAEAAAILAAIAGLGFARRRRRESEEDA
jgi:LPXTG-motif cell wall-anchored protein